MKKKSVLIVVDLQNDFVTGGNLAVKDGEKIVDVVNNLLPKFDLVIFTQDWHPENHKSFASQHEGKNPFDVIDLNGINQCLWPDHCVQNTPGADLLSTIDFGKIKDKFYIFKKGLDIEVDSYSGFYDNNSKNSTGLAEFLNEQAVSDVFVCGLALDYCVAYTAIDATMEAFNTTVVIDATKSIGDITEALMNFKEAGVKVIESWELDLFKLTN